MKILTLSIEYSSKGGLQERLFSNSKNYTFENTTLITSEEKNSRGKTTLVRFILFALGYKISLTDGMDAYNYKTTLEIEIKNKKYIIVRERDITYLKDQDNNMKIPREGLLNKLLDIKELELTDSLLGCYYIDQEKGWTLLNRGRIIGKLNFNIEKLLVALDKLSDVEEKISENEYIEKEIGKIKIIESIRDFNEDYTSNDEIIDPLIKIKEDLKNDLNLVKTQMNLKEKEIKSLTNLLEENELLYQSIENMNIVIKEGEKKILVTKENLLDAKIQEDMLKLEINEKELEKRRLNKTKEKLLRELKKYSNDSYIINLENVFSQVKELEIPWEKLSLLKETNQKSKRENKKIIKEDLRDAVSFFWKILKEVLEKIEISNEYIYEDIILTSRLSGISGTQLHKLTFSYKIALTLLIKEKLGIVLPFIIDSPRSGEISPKVANKMLEICYELLKGHQIIVSSVYNDYSVKFERTILMNKGVVDELEAFFGKKNS